MDTSALAPVKCLLVDDLQENLLALSALLARGDVEILTARSGAEALELLLVHDVALAFLDVQMPDMDGFELAELLRGSERTRHIPLIFVTAGARERHRQFKGYELGAVDFIYKPIEPHILKNKADVFFQLYRQRQALSVELNDRTETLRLNEMFSALLAHDLRSPLSAMLASARLLERRSADQAALEAAGRIIASGNRMARMIEDMLDLARARLGGGILVKREPGDFKALVERALREHQAAAPERSIAASYAGDFAGYWDPERIAQVASNLIGNALKHGTPEGQIQVNLDGIDRDHVILIVKNGGTIPPDILPYLFDPFRGGQRHSGRGDGLGLGLYIVSQIVEAHDGDVEVKTGGDGETAFHVRLPRGEIAPRANASSRSTSSEPDRR
jgi:two-component system sensor histidine kinase/response regulator